MLASLFAFIIYKPSCHSWVHLKEKNDEDPCKVI